MTVPDTPLAPIAAPRIQSVARAVAILEAVAQSPDGLTAAEVSAAVALKRATTYHLLHTLTSVGYLVSGPRRRYRLGLGLGLLVEGFERQVLAADLLPLARELASETGETAYVAARQGSRFVLVGSARGHHPVGVATSTIGPIQEAHARASGKLLLAHAPEPVRDEYLARHPLVAITDHTVTDRTALQAELRQILLDGHAADHSEYAVGVSCIAVPMAGGTYALALSAPEARYDTNLEQYVEIAKRIAAKV